jgi:heavy metal sensor kinase
VFNFKPHSIRFWLTAWYATILGITFAGAAVVVWITLAHSIKVTVDKEIRARFATVRAYVEEEASGKGAAHITEELTEDAVVNSGSAYLRIADRNGTFIYVSPTAQKWPLKIAEEGSLPAAGAFQTLSINRNPFRILTAPVSIGTVQIGLPTDEFLEMQQQFLWTVVFGVPILLLISAVAGYWMSGRALRPVERIAVAAERITSANLSERLPCTGADDELDRLSEVLNKMLAGLESSFRRIAQFTADASHELRTPLAIIRTTAELISSRPRLPDEHNRAWASVLAQTERTTQLIDDLLTLARSDAGADTLDLQPTEIAGVVSAAVSAMQVLAGLKGVHLRFMPIAQPVLLVDADALGRVFTILLDNAIKATAPDGLIVVSLALEHEPKGDVAVITLKDTGAGISPEDLPHIFDRFYRASRDRSRETGGAGLGLAIAQWIVSRHDGLIQAQSQLGKGATFRVILPSPSKIPASFTDSSESQSILKANS